MPNGGIFMRLPEKFSKNDFKIFKSVLDAFEDWLVTPDEKASPQSSVQIETVPPSFDVSMDRMAYEGIPPKEK